MTVEITALSITGQSGASLPNRFFQQTGAASGLAILYPGLNYTCDMPLLYYPRWFFALRGMDVLQVWADYTRQEFQSLGRGEQAARMGGDALAALKAGRSRQVYERIVLVGKSIGTLALAHLLATGEAARATMVWLTPLLRQPHLVEAALRCSGPALFVVGTGDSTYEPAALERIRAACGAEALVLEGANHSLEIPGDPYCSLQFLNEMLKSIETLLEKR